MKTADFDYALPPELIAQTPPENRQAARLLVAGSENGPCLDQQFSSFDQFCEAGDLVVMNNTRVVPARIHCHKSTGGRVEVMLERVLSDTEFLAMVRTSKSLKPDHVLYIDGKPTIQFIERSGMFFKFRILQKALMGAYTLFHAFGEIPLPPYINRKAKGDDQSRYQTVYAQADGAVAAPTAGLHFDEEIIARLKVKGVDVAELTLHVGAGTFQPVKVEDVTQHQMHREWIQVDRSLVEKIEQTKAAGGRVIAIGTTTVRALESAASGGALAPYVGETDIFIYPGFEFKAVDLLLTNFHLPKSTLLMMITAFAGYDRVRQAYTHAIENKYRFFSYGDAMLLFPSNDKKSV